MVALNSYMFFDIVNVLCNNVGQFPTILEQLKEAVCIAGLEHATRVDLLRKRIERARTCAEVLNVKHRGWLR